MGMAQNYADVGPCVHLPGFHFGTGFLSLSHIGHTHHSIKQFPMWHLIMDRGRQRVGLQYHLTWTMLFLRRLLHLGVPFFGISQNGDVPIGFPLTPL